MNINESFFREDMLIRGDVEYIDDLNANQPLKYVAKDYAKECIRKAIGALIESNEYYEQTSDDMAKFEFNDLRRANIENQLLIIANDIFDSLLEEQYRVID